MRKRFLRLEYSIAWAAWGGPGLKLAPCEPTEKDMVINCKGMQFAIDKKFLEKAKPVKVFIKKNETCIVSSFKAPLDKSCGDKYSSGGCGDKCSKG